MELGGVVQIRHCPPLSEERGVHLHPCTPPGYGPDICRVDIGLKTVKKLILGCQKRCRTQTWAVSLELPSLPRCKKKNNSSLHFLLYFNYKCKQIIITHISMNCLSVNKRFVLKLTMTIMTWRGLTKFKQLQLVNGSLSSLSTSSRF